MSCRTGLTLVVVILLGATLAARAPARAPPQQQRLLHATYAVGKRLRSPARIEKTDFKAFDCVFLAAGPAWAQLDFASADADAIARVVAGHAYPSGDTGEALVPLLIERAHAADTKVVVSVPGHEQFRKCATDPKKRRHFAEAMAAFVKKFDYDGIDIDWEGGIELETHAALLENLRAALVAVETNDRPFLLTTALHSYHDIPAHVAASWCRSLDWINLMTYDLGGGTWGHAATHNAPLPTIRRHVQEHYVGKGIPPNKLCIGLANYGFLYHGLRPGETTTEKLGTKGRDLPHRELPDLLAKGWREEYDTTADAPYYFSADGRSFATMDNERSLAKKVAWIRSEGLLGMFWWELHSDLQPDDGTEGFDAHPSIDSVTKRLHHCRRAGTAPADPPHRSHTGVLLGVRSTNVTSPASRTGNAPGVPARDTARGRNGHPRALPRGTSATSCRHEGHDSGGDGRAGDRHPPHGSGAAVTVMLANVAEVLAEIMPT